MKRVILVVLAAGLVAGQVGAAGAARFAKFKFQPEKKYIISILQQGEMTASSTGESDEQSGPFAAGNLKQSLKLKVDLQTFAVSSANTIPLSMRFHDLEMEVKSGDQTITMPIPKDNLGEKEYQAELDDEGDIKILNDTSLIVPGAGAQQSLYQLLFLIPDLPEREIKVGDVFENEAKYPEGESGFGEGRMRYKVEKIDGDEVTISSVFNATVTNPEAGLEENAVGAKGTIIYSIKDKICKSIVSDMVINIAAKDPSDESGKEVKRVIVNKMHLVIKVKAVD